MIILAVHSLARIDSVEIRTIYLDGNSATKFRPLADYWRVPARPVRYTFVSIARSYPSSSTTSSSSCTPHR